MAFILLAAIGATPVSPCLAQEQLFSTETVEARTRSRKADGTIVYSDWKPFQTRTIRAAATPAGSFSKYGGDLSVRIQGTGFFRTAKIKNRWWIIDPLGHPFIHMAVNSVNQGKSRRNRTAATRLFSNKADWALKSVHLFQELGFNGSGSWSDTDAIVAANQSASNPLVYTINMNFMGAYGDKRGGTYQVPGHKAYPNGAIFVFDPAFEQFCDEYARKITQYARDPNLLGYFSDNEMPLSLKNLEGYLTLPDRQDPGYLAAKKWLDEQGITQGEITDRHREEFLAYAAGRYFSIVSRAVKKYDPHHLYLGCRFYAGEKNNRRFMETAGKHMDIVSINYYGVWTPTKKHLDNWGMWTQKPFMITEFYTKGEDSGLPNRSGAGWIVKTQEDRGKAYQNYCLALLASKSCVGWHWFKYQDNDPEQENAEPSNTDANKGLVNNDYEVYQPLAERMQALHLRAYQLIHYFDRQHE